MAHYSIVFLDVDGTLLDSSHRVSEATRDMLRRLNRKKVPVVLASARPPKGLEPIYQQLGFQGPAICCAGALAVMNELTDDLLAKDRALAETLRAGLKTLPHVTEVSGLGLMVGIALEEGVSAAAVRTACEQEGLLVLTAKTRLRLLPPLILTQEDVDKALAILRTVLEKL